MTAEPSAARSDDNPAALPIALFDSGVGGLTVLDAMRRLMPEEDYLFLGDTARVPYGAKSPKTIIRYTLQAAAKLIGLRVKLLVIACNTATAAALPALRETWPDMPIIGVVDPGARAACEASLSGDIAVIHHPQRGLCRGHPPPPPGRAGPQPRLPPLRAAGRGRLVRRSHRRGRGRPLS